MRYKQVQLLTLILMQALGLDIEHRIGVDAHLLGTQQPVCQCLLIGFLHGGQLVQHGLIILAKASSFSSSAGILAETGADVLFQHLLSGAGRTPAASGGT